MSEENYNSNEETQALFVSTQKKKQAEEEARKKAEAEQARRDAAEAEVRRMEQEVEERKRRAEEERQALEEAAREAEAANASQVDKLKAKVNTAVNSIDTEAIKTMAKEKTVPVGKSKVPLFAAIGAAVVVVILVAVFVLKGKGGSKAADIDYSTLEFNKEYTISKEGIESKFFYPEALYDQVTPDEIDEGARITLTSEAGTAPEMQVTYSPQDLEQGKLGFISAKDLQKGLTENAQAVLKDNETMNIIEEQTTDITSDNPGKYSYRSTYSYGEGIFGAASSWLVLNEDGKTFVVSCYVEEQAENADNVAKIRDLFEAKNSENALKVPGENPPKEATTDGRLEIDAMHMGIVVPKDQFKKLGEIDDGVVAWSDDNGAMFMVMYDDAGDITFDDYGENFDAFNEAFKQSAEMSLNAVLPSIESRMYLGDLPAPENRTGYFAEYKDMIGGLSFWEGYHAGMWQDTRTKHYYFYSLIVMAPEKNMDIYKQMYTTAYDRMEDI
ncbi:MAG: hypothetical protein K6A71_01145 [Lachnospiraceae bacterium]|nr:hypothetical protein [Lachnospiraceae bacterium]